MTHRIVDTIKKLLTKHAINKIHVIKAEKTNCLFKLVPKSITKNEEECINYNELGLSKDSFQEAYSGTGFNGGFTAEDILSIYYMKKFNINDVAGFLSCASNPDRIISSLHDLFGIALPKIKEVLMVFVSELIIDHIKTKTEKNFYSNPLDLHLAQYVTNYLTKKIKRQLLTFEWNETKESILAGLFIELDIIAECKAKDVRYNPVNIQIFDEVRKETRFGWTKTILTVSDSNKQYPVTYLTESIRPAKHDYSIYSNINTTSDDSVKVNLNDIPQLNDTDITRLKSYEELELELHRAVKAAKHKTCLEKLKKLKLFNDVSPTAIMMDITVNKIDSNVIESTLANFINLTNYSDEDTSDEAMLAKACCSIWGLVRKAYITGI